MITLGSGVITYKALGNGADIPLGEIDGDCELDLAYESKVFRGQSMFPRMKAFHSGKATIKCKKVEFNAANLVNLLGLAKTTGSGTEIYTLSQTTRPAFVSISFTHTRSDDATKTIKIAAPKVFSEAFNLPFPKEDFVLVDVEFELLADDTGKVADITVSV